MVILWYVFYALLMDHRVTYNTAIGLGFVAFIFLLAMPRPLTKTERRQKLVQQVVRKFRNIAQRIVDFQYRPTSKFNQNDLMEALGMSQLPEPEYISKFESQYIYTFRVKQTFLLKITIISGMMEIGKGMSYVEYGSSGYEFGGCAVYESETQCADFNYKMRFISWLTDEFQHAAGFGDEAEYLEHYLDVEQKRLSAWLKKAS